MDITNHEINDLDNHSLRSFTNLIRDYQTKKMTLVCGAGISVSAGLPSWKNYIKKIVSVFLIHWKELEKENTKYKHFAPKKMSINFLEEFYEHNYPNFDLADEFINDDPLILAQLIKNCIEPNNWKYLLRESLYGHDRMGLFSSKLIDFLCHLVHRNNNISSIITYNYDDILERTFDKLNFKTNSIISENHYKQWNEFPIYHVHGILPFKGGIEGKIYLSEEDYLTDIIKPNSWYNQLHANKLTSSCCLFIGLSFNDPSLKRKLAMNRLDPSDHHYAFLTHKETETDRRKFLLLRNELLRLNVRVVKYKYDEKHENLNKLLLLFDKHINQNVA
jgi:hypothetical protein